MKTGKFILKCLKLSALCLCFSFIILIFYPVGYFVLESTNEISKEEMSTHPKEGVGVYIINLDRSVERYNYVKQFIDPLGFPIERISAIDGNSLSEKEIDILTEKFNHFCGRNHKGAIGCSLSHIKTWQTFLESDFAYALIFEDDVSFNPIHLRAVIEQLTRLTQYWDINSFNINGNGTPLTIKILQNDQRLVIYSLRVLCAGAYIMNRKAARQLLDKAIPIKMPIDLYFSRGWEFGLKFTGVENPRLVRQTHGSSEITQSDRFNNEEAETTSFFTDFKYRKLRQIARFQSNLMGTFYNLRNYLESIFLKEGED